MYMCEHITYRMLEQPRKHVQELWDCLILGSQHVWENQQAGMTRSLMVTTNWPALGIYSVAHWLSQICDGQVVHIYITNLFILTGETGK